jgi:hypothetical protein
VASDLIAGRQSYRSLKIRLVRNAPVIALQALVRRLGRARRGAGAISGRSVLRPNRGS